VVITDVMAAASTGGTSTPAGEPDGDFFSSWDKPSIKRPTPPPSRTATPPVVGRTPSPFLNAGQNGNGTRSKSPLGEKETTSRTTSSAALRKTATTGPRKANVLGAKKTQKLGAKKIVAADGIDFEAAEKKAREEAERIEKLGYDPNAEDTTVMERGKTRGSISDGPTIIRPTPVSPKGAGIGATAGHGRSNSEIERLGMGVGRLGFGQVGGGKAAAAAPPKKLGFGSTGSSSKAIDEGKNTCCRPALLLAI
jgi:ADP-ribosylation factor GTPase-activating protein 2/3